MNERRASQYNGMENVDDLGTILLRPDDEDD